jgi:tripartite-type tricarboxylate transporter receptor subunit TctC
MSRFVVGAALILAAGIVQAQSYPTRSIRFIVPVPPGGGSDVTARMLAPRLSEVLGQQVVVDNRAGGNAMIGAELAAKSPPDGHTWLLGTSQHTVTPALVKSVPVSLLRDFIPVTVLVRAPQLLMVHPAVPARNVKELIALAKSRKGALNYGSGGIGSASHFSAELLKSMAKIDMAHIPYKGVGLAFSDLLGGQIDLMFPAIPSGVPYHRAGRVRALAVTGPNRHVSIPDIPTVAESGVPGYQVASWYGILLPAKTPPEIVNRVHSAFMEVLALPEIKAAVAREGGETAGMPAEAFAKFIEQELKRNADIVKAAGLTAE